MMTPAQAEQIALNGGKIQNIEDRGGGNRRSGQFLTRCQKIYRHDIVPVEISQNFDKFESRFFR